MERLKKESSYGSRLRARPRLIDRDISVILIYLTLIYLNIGFMIGGRYINGVVAVIFSVVASFNVKKETNFHGAIWAVYYTCIGLASLLATAYEVPLSGRISSVMLLGCSVFMSINIYQVLIKCNKDKLYKVLIALIVFVFLGTALEVLGVLRPFSDSFRNFMFRDAFVYSSDARDINVYGSVRPNFFSQEPSHLGKLIGLLAFSVYALKPNKVTFTASLAVLLFGIFLARSPSSVPALFLIFILHFNIKCRDYRSRRIINIIAAISIVSFFIFLPSIASLVPFKRGNLIAQMSDASAIERYLAPFWIAVNSIKTHPLFGIGTGSHGAYLNMVIDAYARFPYYSFYRLHSGDTNFGWYSAFYEGIACFGLLGTGFFVWGLLRAYRSPGVALAPSSILPVFVVVTLLDSGIPSPRVWAYIAFYLYMFNAGLFTVKKTD